MTGTIAGSSIPFISRDTRLVELALWLRVHEDEAVEIAERGRPLADALTFDHVIDKAVEAICRHVEAPR